jgi:hypothetical protein
MGGWMIAREKKIFKLTTELFQMDIEEMTHNLIELYLNTGWMVMTKIIDQGGIMGSDGPMLLEAMHDIIRASGLPTREAILRVWGDLDQKHLKELGKRRSLSFID